VTDEKYDEAHKLLQKALKERKDFPHAETLLDYTNVANKIENELKTVNQLMDDKAYQESLEHIAAAEDRLTAYSGPVVSNLVDEINQLHATAKLELLKVQLDESPSYEELRILIWEAEEINLPEADDIADSIRKRMIDYTFSRAS